MRTAASPQSAIGGDPRRAGDLERLILPDLGRALLEQRRVTEAFAILDPFVPRDPADPRHPSAALARDWCRAVGACLSEDDGVVREVRGVGDDPGRSALGRVTQLYAKLDAEEAAREPGRGRGSCPWLELKLAETYAGLRWSEIEPNRRRGARAHLDEARMPGSRAAGAAAGAEPGCADEHLRARLAWLEARLP